MLGLFVAGLVILVVGLLGIGFGIPVKEFSFGNTLIVTGALGACTGALLIAIGLVVRELRSIARALASAAPADLRQDPFPAPPVANVPRPAAETRGPEPSRPSDALPPWQAERAVRDRATPAAEPAPAPEPVPAPPAQEPARKRRNLLFTSTRREREAPEGDAEATSAEEPVESTEPHPSFDDAWPVPDRGRAARRTGREPEEVKPAPMPPPIRRPAEAPPVTVLKSGVVDGMAYSLYSDGSIEAQMPEGMVRFASIEDLRRHLEQRGG
ncbi:DUF308 domain-containing protein [Bradyrhizobium sp. 2TAF24]|uniref:DUF308 domain-containing protein n=1 Tax=Bradyrhizobium sp. 2TAF24 TaxID=3233011 RepID=UPI003F91D0AD